MEQNEMTPQEPLPVWEEDPASAFPSEPAPAQPPKKRKTWLILLLILLAAAAVAVAAVVFCLPKEPELELLHLNKHNCTMMVGETLVLEYRILPEDFAASRLQWQSSDPSVAAVEQGTVTAVAEGMCTVTLTADSGERQECEITVERYIDPDIKPMVGVWYGYQVYNCYKDTMREAPEYTYLILREDMTGELFCEGQRYEIESWELRSKERDRNNFDVYFTEDKGGRSEFTLYDTGLMIAYIGSREFSLFCMKVTDDPNESGRWSSDSQLWQKPAPQKIPSLHHFAEREFSPSP